MAKISLDSKFEEELINRCKSDKNAFGTLYSHYAKYILAFIKSKVESIETAEDICSMVFKKAFENIDGFKWQGISFSSWLYRIAKNSIIDYYRSKKDFVTTDYTTVASPEKSPEELFEKNAFEESIRKLIETLPEKERKIIYMKFFEGYTNKTISKILNLSESNIGTIVYRAISKLRESFN